MWKQKVSTFVRRELVDHHLPTALNTFFCSWCGKSPQTVAVPPVRPWKVLLQILLYQLAAGFAVNKSDCPASDPDNVLHRKLTVTVPCIAQYTVCWWTRGALYPPLPECHEHCALNDCLVQISGWHSASRPVQPAPKVLCIDPPYWTQPWNVPCLNISHHHRRQM